ncbi:BMP family lipoprotein [Allofustis seminis]|uniref:BMP family lipoprotein n=1 Tax=Allofustis seminis TaxID=166939 RepID=UPI0003645C19|nr:BMP family ABC transporter substrate-binding protein [Allofustis seminis]
MKNWKSLMLLGTSALVLVACGNKDANKDAGKDNTGEGDFKITMITDTGGVDDRSFNQSSWEGVQEWVKENNLPQSSGTYIQSDAADQYIPNIQQAVNDGYDIIYAIGFLLAEPLEEVAKQHPDQHFGIVDGFVDLPNVISLGFKDHESSFLAGVAAAYTTETNHVGFIGGEKGFIIDRFETGYKAGVEWAAKKLGKEIKIDSEYAESFKDAAKGKQIAASQFSSGADVVFHASGAVGDGVFNEAKDRMQADSSKKIWVIGVDRDQEAEGEYEGGNLTLTSALKQVGQAIKLTSNDVMKGEFKGGQVVYGLKDDGVGLSRGHLSDEAWKAVEEAKKLIVDGEIEVPEFTYSQN